MKSSPFPWIVLGLTCAALVITDGCSSGDSDPADSASQTHQEGARTVTGGEPFHGLLEYRAKDAKLALVRPTLMSIDQAPLADGVGVVGVTANGDSRAYPLYILKNHQIVNDRVGGMPIAASW